MSRNRVIVALGIVVFLVLAGTGTANALWSSLTTSGGTVTAARMGITQTGFEAIAVEFSATTAQKLAPVTVTNTGTLPVTYSLLLRGPSNNTLATATSVQTRIVASAGSCTATATSTTTNWTNLPAVTGSLEPGASVIHCVQSSLTRERAVQNSGKSMQATLALTAAATGSWTASANAAATLSARVALPGKPTTLLASDTSGYSTTLNWADGATSANSATTGYNVYRDGTLVATNVKSPYTDATVVKGTTYQYTVQARDATGTTSEISDAVSVSTLNIPSSVPFTISPSGRNLMCIDVVSGSNRNGSAVETAFCDNSSAQAWTLVPTGNGTYRVSAGHVAASGWSIPSTSNNAVQLWAYNNDSTSKWRAVPVGTATTTTTFQFVNEATDRCLDLSHGALLFSARLIQTDCRASTDAGTQAFTLRTK